MPHSRDPHAPKPFRLRTFGAPALVDPAGTAVVAQRRRLALLAIVASGGERGVSRDKLIALLSPDSPADSARHALHQLLYYLRQLIGEAGFLGTDPLRLNPAVVAVDTADFEAALERESLEEAVSLYRGPFLDGFHLGDSAEFEEWMAQERARLAARYAEALQQLARGADRRGDHSRAPEWWRRLAALDPLSSGAALGLMRSLAAAGDRPAALRHARAHEALVRAEVGASADPEVGAYAAELLRGDPIVAPTPSPPPPVILPGGAPAVSAAGEGDPARGAGDPPPKRRSRAVLVAAGLAAAAVTATLVVRYAGWPAARSADLAAESVAVLPFRVVPADTGFQWMREGMAELMAIRLGGEGGVGVVDPARTLAAWHREVAGATAALPDEARLSVARAVGAGRIVEGSVIGNAKRIVLHASLLRMPGARVIAAADAEGSPDSAGILVDRVAAQLLGSATGVDQARLASLARHSFPAIREFLAGRAASRRGNYTEAVRRLKEAVMLDSTFALGGLELARASGWGGTSKDGALGMRVALAGRDRLSAADRTLLSAMEGDVPDAPDMLARWHAATAAYPHRPETWYSLGDAYFHWGGLAGIEDAVERAERAFRRGWEVDSAGAGAAASGAPLFPEPMEHMIQIAHMRRDTAAVRHMLSRVIAADSESVLSNRLRWHLAALGDSAVARRYWTRPDQGALMEAALFMSWTGVSAEEFPRVAAEDRRRLAADDVPYREFALAIYARNGGRPAGVPSGTERRGWPAHEAIRNRLRDAVWWDGDTVAARAAAEVLTRAVEASPGSVAAARARYQDVCALGLWRAAHGEFDAAAAASRELRGAGIAKLSPDDSASVHNHSRLCAGLLDAWRASALRLPKANAKLALADSLARTWVFAVCCGEAIAETNLLLARLWEAAGDVPRARMAIRRRAGGFMIAPLLMSSFLHEEGRLSALLADTASAVRAYRHYLMFRHDPAPELRPEVERVRQELEMLQEARRRLD